MDDINEQNPELADDDEARITDLDLPVSSLQKRVIFVTRVINKGLIKPWIRFALSCLLLLILIAAFILQWPQPPSAPTNTVPTLTRSVLSASTEQGLIFIQDSSFTLTAYQVATWRALWHIKLPAAATILTQQQTLFCSFAMAGHKTELEALNEHTGKSLWHDVLPETHTSAFQYPHQTIPDLFYSENTLYVQSVNDTIYAIQASTGLINWTHQTRDAGNPPQAGIAPLLSLPLSAEDGVVTFLSTKGIIHVLNGDTGQDILSFPTNPVSFSPPVIDQKTLYTLPPTDGMAIQAFSLPNGQRTWRYPLSDDMTALVVMNGTVYLSKTSNSTLIALRGSDGHKIWSYQMSDNQPVAHTFFAAQGIIYLLQQDATLVSLRASDGQVLWHTRVADFAGHINQTTDLLADDEMILLRPLEQSASTSIDVLSTSDGHLRWHLPGTTTNPFIFSGILYVIQNNGQIDAWRENNGQHIWSYDAPIGSTFVWSLESIPGVFFLRDVLGKLYALRLTDGRLLWHFP